MWELFGLRFKFWNPTYSSWNSTYTSCCLGQLFIFLSFSLLILKTGIVLGPNAYEC